MGGSARRLARILTDVWRVSDLDLAENEATSKTNESNLILSA